MKALFYRTFYVNMDFSFFAFLGPLLLCVVPLPWLTSIFLPVLMGSLPMLFLLQRDQKDRWYDLAPMLPLSPRDLVKENYFLAGICARCSPGIMAVGQTVARSDEIPTPSLDMSLFATGALFLFFACFLPLAFFQTAKRIWVPYLIVLALFYAIESMMISWQRQHQGLSILHDFLWVLILGALLFLVSFPLSMRLYAHQRSSAFGAAASPFHRWRDRTSAAKAARVLGKNASLRALLYKDSILIRKKMLGFLIPAAYLLVVIRFPMGNTDLCFLPLLGLVVPLQLMALDEQSRWTFALRLYPHSPWAVVLSRYIWGWIFTLLGGALSVGSAYLLYPYEQLAVPSDTLFFLFWMVGIVLAGLGIEIPLLFRTGVVHGKVASLAILLAFLLVILNLLADFNPSNPFAAFAHFLPLLKALSPLALGVGLAVNLLSIPLAVREYRLTAAAT